MILVICFNKNKQKKSRFDEFIKSAASINNVEIRVTPDSSDLNDIITLAMLRLEQELFSCKQFYSDHPRYSAIMLMFDPAWFVDIANLLDKCSGLRGDEMIFSNLDCQINVDWIIAHPRSIIRWAAGLPYVSKLGFNTWPMLEHKSDTAFYVWWAQRNNLKVLG